MAFAPRAWVAVIAVSVLACGNDLSLGQMVGDDAASASGGAAGSVAVPDASIVGGNGGSGADPDTGGGGADPDLDVTNVGSESSYLDASGESGDADSTVRFDARDGARADVADVAAEADGRADVSVCSVAGAVCARPDDCCSGFCIGRVCVAPTTCQVPGTTCTQGGACCSGRCDPATGANLSCRDYCSADGVRCARADECCSLGCLNGICGSLCRSQGGACTSNADCCSNNCNTATRICGFVGNDHDICQFAGENCVNTDEAITCCTSCNPTTGRCNLAASTCRGLGAACTADPECCKGHCSVNALNQRVCQIQCGIDGDACGANAECCSFRCSGSPARCGPPESVDGGATCQLTGRTCTTNAQCCSRYCVAGFCDMPCQLRGVACRVGTDCCSGICTASLCQ